MAITTTKPASGPTEFLRDKHRAMLGAYHKEILHFSTSEIVFTAGLQNALRAAAGQTFRKAVREACLYWGTLEITAALEELGIKSNATPTKDEHREYMKSLAPAKAR